MSVLGGRGHTHSIDSNKDFVTNQALDTQFPYRSYNFERKLTVSFI